MKAKVEVIIYWRMKARIEVMLYWGMDVKGSNRSTIEYKSAQNPFTLKYSQTCQQWPQLKQTLLSWYTVFCSGVRLYLDYKKIYFRF